MLSLLLMVGAQGRTGTLPGRDSRIWKVMNLTSSSLITGCAAQ
jgi:hypothetical protein